MRINNKTYKINKEAKTGTEITCPVCGTKFIKKQYSQAFCCTQCKDSFWNKRGDRHKDPNYYSKYNQGHPERLNRIDIYPDEDDSWTLCDNPILGI